MRKIDIITFGFLSFLVAITIIFIRQIPDAYSLLSIYVFLIAGLSLLIYFRKKHTNRVVEIMYDLIFPIIAVLLIFDSMGGLIRYVNPATYDYLLIRLDYMIFKAYPTVFLERFTTPVITEVLQLAYTSYYFLPIVLGVTLKVKGSEREFDRTLFLILLCFFLSYVGYILVPAIGPRYVMDHLHKIELQGFFLRDSINGALNHLEGTKRDAFPSGHTAVSLVVLYLAYKFQKNLFWIFLPVVSALVVATVYLRYHYVVDVIGGILLFVFTIYFGEKYYNMNQKSANGIIVKELNKIT